VVLQRSQPPADQFKSGVFDRVGRAAGPAVHLAHPCLPRDYQPWFDNSRRLRALVSEFENLSLRVVDDDPRWGRK
jgi:hypothetical protein